MDGSEEIRISIQQYAEKLINIETAVATYQEATETFKSAWSQTQLDDMNADFTDRLYDLVEFFSTDFAPDISEQVTEFVDGVFQWAAAMQAADEGIYYIDACSGGGVTS